MLSRRSSQECRVSIMLSLINSPEKIQVIVSIIGDLIMPLTLVAVAIVVSRIWKRG
jgi:hypothetical protein